MVYDNNMFSTVIMLWVFDQIESLLVIFEKLNWEIRYVIKIELLDSKCVQNKIFTCLTNNNKLSFSRGGRDSFLLFASLHNWRAFNK